jgi:hypothetical protein
MLHNGTRGFANYETFAVAPETENFNLTVHGYYGNIGNLIKSSQNRHL